MNNKDMRKALIRTISQDQPSLESPMRVPIPIRPRARTRNCCPTYRRLQTVNTIALALSIFMIIWYLKDLIVGHFDRETSDYLGLGAGGVYFGLGIYACWYSYQMQQKADAEEARTLLEIDDDEEQIRISVAESKVNVFPARQSPPAPDNNISSTGMDMKSV